MPAAIERTTKKDIIKIGTADVIIQEDNEGLMIFGESANTTKKKIWLPSKQPIQNTPCLDGAQQDWHGPKEKITTPKSKREPGKGGGKDIQWHTSTIPATAKEMETKGRWGKANDHKNRK
jgi:hypothetical protein